jgi:hypothetical protein
VGAAGAFAWSGLRRVRDVPHGQLHVLLPESIHFSDARIVSLAQRRTLRRPLQDELTDRRPIFQSLDKAAVSCNHVIAHFHQERTGLTASVLDAQAGI